MTLFLLTKFVLNVKQHSLSKQHIPLTMFTVSRSFTCLLALVLITAAPSTAKEGENHFSPSVAFAPGAIPDLKLKRRGFDARPLESGGSSPLSKMLQKASRTRSAVLSRSSSPVRGIVLILSYGRQEYDARS